MRTIITLTLVCSLIATALLGAVAALPPRGSVHADDLSVGESLSAMAPSYLFVDPLRGTRLYINTSSQVYRFTAPDGYDTGIIDAGDMWKTPDDGDADIIIHDSVKGFLFHSTVSFAENRVNGFLHDRLENARYLIHATTIGSEVADSSSIPPTTVVLGNTTLHYLSSVSEGDYTLTFDKTTRQLLSVSPGDVIVIGVSDATPYGLLRIVTNVATIGDQTIIDTAPATLEDAIEDGIIGGSWQLLPDGSVVPLTLTQDSGPVYASASAVGSIASSTGAVGDSEESVSVSALSSACDGFYIDIDNVLLYDMDGDLTTTDDQVKVSGSLCAEIGFDLEVVIEDWALTEAEFEFTVEETAQLELTAQFTIVEAHPKKEVYRQYLSPIVVWVGFLPVVITPVLTVNIGADLEVSVGITTSITQTADLSVGLKYDNGTWSAPTDFSTDFGWDPPTLTAGCQVKGYVGPQLSFLLYGLVGPYGEVRGYLELDADLFRIPWWQLYGGLEAVIGFRMEVLGHNIIDYEVPMAIGYRALLTQADTGDLSDLVAGVSEVVSPGVPGPVQAEVPDWVPIVAGDENAACAGDTSGPKTFVMARSYGAGRVVIMGHDGLIGTLDQLDNKQFALNIVSWLDGSDGKRVMFSTGHGEWVTSSTLNSLRTELQSRGYSFEAAAAPISSSFLAGRDVLIFGNAWGTISPSEISAVETFVANGGGLFLIGLGWSWGHYHPTPIEEYPMMKLAVPYGVRWLECYLWDVHYDQAPIFNVFYPNI